jgi:anti-anti-sigma factor
MDADVPEVVIARLRAQLDSMPVIEQAKGIIMAREGCAPEAAFDLLRRASQRANLKLHVLAASLVEQVTGRAVSTAAATEPDRGGRTAGSADGELTVDGLSQRRGGGRLPAGPGPGTVVVPLPGELTFDNAEQVGAALAAAFGPGIRAVVADGTPTVFCDSCGMRELVTAHKRAIAAGTDFRVVVLHHNLRDRLIRTGLATYLPLYATLGDALPAGVGIEAAVGDSGDA